MKPRWRQLGAVFRIELSKALAPRRSFWIYLLALAPLLIVAFYVYQVQANVKEQTAWAAASPRPLQDADFASLPTGLSTAALAQRLGPPARQFRRPVRGYDPHGHAHVTGELRVFTYATTDATFSVVLRDGHLQSVHRESTPSFADSGRVFASLYQFFTLRLVVFFGCLGLFLRLFRGEMLQHSLHFYFLAPVRRDVVLAGKFLAAWVAAVIVFCGSLALQLLYLGYALDPFARAQFLSVQHGWAQIGAYMGVTALACLGYGAFFLAAGVFLKNPIVPAAVLLVWEAINPFLPSLLKHISIIYYLTGLLPVRLASGPETSSLFALLATSGNALAAGWDILGLLVLTAVLLGLAVWRLRSLEIDYAAE